MENLCSCEIGIYELRLEKQRVSQSTSCTLRRALPHQRALWKPGLHVTALPEELGVAHEEQQPVLAGVIG